VSEDLHGMDPSRFQREVQSFEFWFGAVQGYLEGTAYGHHEQAPAALEAGEQEALITVLCNYALGETTALDGAGALIRLAPNGPTKVFLATQVVDEGRHLEVLTHRLEELGVEDVEAEVVRRADPSLLAFRRRLLELIDRGDWNLGLFAQNVVLESMEFATFDRHARMADPITREVLNGIVKDERRHVGFGENQLGRAIQADPLLAVRLREARYALDPLVLDTFEHVATQLRIPASERADLGRAYIHAVERMGVG
jgi:1,2-phenylacetyl-CoA epoxidase catalytic subunit